MLRSRRTLRTASLAVALLLTGCSATRPVTSAPTPASIQGYLDRHPHAALRVADSTGRSQWIYEAELRGDTLRGLRTSTMPRDSIAVAEPWLSGSFDALYDVCVPSNQRLKLAARVD